MELQILESTHEKGNKAMKSNICYAQLGTRRVKRFRDVRKVLLRDLPGLGTRISIHLEVREKRYEDS